MQLFPYTIPKPDTPFWKGPCIDGVTQSLINTWKQCPFRAYLKMILGLTEVTPPHENLVWGDCYHVGLEHLLSSKQPTLLEAQRSLLEYYSNIYEGKYQHYDEASYKTSMTLMLGLYDTTLLPQENRETEVQLDAVIDGYRFRGKRDILGETYIGEHKAKNFYYIDPELLMEEIEKDLQCNIYMKVSEVETVYYDLIGIPETAKRFPYRARDKTSKQFMTELFYGGSYKATDMYPIVDNAYRWVSQRPYVISAESQHRYWLTTVLPLVKRIHEWYDYVTSDEFDPNNPECYNATFYVMPVRSFEQSNTAKFKCDYHALLTEQQDFGDLVPIKSLYSELSDD